MHIDLPEFSLVLLIGSAASGKSTLAQQLFASSEILSSDHLRATICDDENDQSASGDAFEILYSLVEKRLKRGRLTVVDATNLTPECRLPLRQFAKKYHAPLIGLLLETPLPICLTANQERKRQVPEAIIREQHILVKRLPHQLKKEGFSALHTIALEQRSQLSISRSTLPFILPSESGPFDFIGDVHGCYTELCQLLNHLGYAFLENEEGIRLPHSPTSRKIVFLGDLIDRGPDCLASLEMAMGVVKSGLGYCLMGNHEAKLLRHLQGHKTSLKHGFEQTVNELKQCSPEKLEEIKSFLTSLPPYLVLDQGHVIGVHAAMKEVYIGRTSKAIHSWCLYGPSIGRCEVDGLPIRINWAHDYHGKATVVYGHTPLEEPSTWNETICIDTGCVFGGRLTAWRYPERELCSVPAKETYVQPIRPLRSLQETMSVASATPKD